MRLADASVGAAGNLLNVTTGTPTVTAALAAGDRSAREVVRRVYVDVDPSLWPAAELNVQAQLEYLGRSPEGS